MYQSSRKPVLRVFSGLFVTLLALVGVAACSAGKPISLPVKLQASKPIESLNQQSTRDAESVSASAAPEVLDDNTPQPSELVGQALIALSTLPSEQVSRLTLENLADVAVRGRCGFIAASSELELVLKDSSFTLEAPVVRYALPSPANESLSFADCRCLVSESEEKLGVSLLPVSTF
ncbi:MAG: hypothetical protein RJB13_1902 [Pseudomonadota bacterium]|jgi:hypothetical protein